MHNNEIETYYPTTFNFWNRFAEVLSVGNSIRHKWDKSEKQFVWWSVLFWYRCPELRYRNSRASSCLSLSQLWTVFTDISRDNYIIGQLIFKLFVGYRIPQTSAFETPVQAIPLIKIYWFWRRQILNTLVNSEFVYEVNLISSKHFRVSIAIIKLIKQVFIVNNTKNKAFKMMKCYWRLNPFYNLSVLDWLSQCFLTYRKGGKIVWPSVIAWKTADAFAWKTAVICNSI